MRIRVLTDVSLPLCRGQAISVESGKTMWISFKYERLPNICYRCGRLEHDDRDCDLWLESEGSLTDNQKQFGPTLRAAPFVPSRKSVISVSGFYKSKLSSPVKNAHRETEGRAEPMMMNRKAPIPDSDPAAVNKPEKSGSVTHQQLSEEAVILESISVTHNVRECSEIPINDSSICPLISGIHCSTIQGTVSSSDLFDVRINEIDSALNKFDPINGPTKSGDISQVAISQSIA